MTGRIFAAALTLLLPTAAFAQQPVWTADDAIAAALANPIAEQILEARIEQARAEYAESTLVPLPRLGAEHEQVFADGDNSVDFTLSASQDFDLTRWRSRLQDAMVHREAALATHVVQLERSLISAAEAAFYAVRHRDERLAVYDAWLASLEAGQRSVAARRDAGDASDFDVLRVERERDLARARRAAEEAVRAEAWAALVSIAPTNHVPTLLGELTPAPPAPHSADELPQIAFLRHTERALAAEASALGNPALRGWNAEGGYRLAHAGAATGHGFVIALSLPLAFRNTDQPRIQRLAAEQDALLAQIAWHTSLADRATAAAEQRLRSALAALESVTLNGGGDNLALIAGIAFASGEASLAELLDATESDADLQLAHIDLQWEARRAAIELNRTRGSGVHE